jgi:hypothetical protein
MTPEKKLAVFEKYDFSKTGLLRGAAIEYDDPKIRLYHDIAGMVQVLWNNLSTVAEGTVQDVKEYNMLQDEIYMCYGWLQLKYQGIAWDELDANDSDFSVFFRMKQSIDDLGYFISSFMDQSRIRLKSRMDSEKYKNIEKQIEEIGQLMQEYRKTKDKLKKKVNPGP